MAPITVTASGGGRPPLQKTRFQTGATLSIHRIVWSSSTDIAGYAKGGTFRGSVSSEKTPPSSDVSTHSTRPSHGGTDRQQVWKCVRGTASGLDRWQPNLAQRGALKSPLNHQTFQVNSGSLNG